MAVDVQTRTIVGLEIHVQLATRSKLFCGCELRFGAEPNSLTCPVCLGLPGALPVLNRRAVEFAVRLGLALGCDIAPLTKWDRKSYYYPDLPKNYQISQYDMPVAANGQFEIPADDGGVRRVRIRRAHLEEDAGKNLHDVGDYSLIDLNRAGTPLLEIVTEPDITSAEEAYAFSVELQKLVTYLGVSEANMQKGQMRFEPNVNVAIVRDGVEHRTPISEVKNLNSFRSVRDAIEYESRRQVRDFLANPNYVFGQTPNENRGWNDARGVTEFQRGKEAAHDYRYFPEPDLAPVAFESAFLDSVRASLPELPVARRMRFMADYGVNEKDADALVGERADADIFDEVAGGDGRLAKRMTSLMLGVGRRIANERQCAVHELLPDAGRWRAIAAMIEDGTINATAGDRLLEELIHRGSSVDVQALATELDLIQVRDEGQMASWVEQVFAENAGAVQDAAGNPKKAKAAAGFLTGQVMRVSGGKADAKLAGELIRQKLEQLKGA